MVDFCNNRLGFRLKSPKTYFVLTKYLRNFLCLHLKTIFYLFLIIIFFLWLLTSWSNFLNIKGRFRLNSKLYYYLFQWRTGLDVTKTMFVNCAVLAGSFSQVCEAFTGIWQLQRLKWHFLHAKKSNSTHVRLKFWPRGWHKWYP